jgi:hypothetical protein
MVPSSLPNPLFSGSRTPDCNESERVAIADPKELLAVQGLERTDDRRVIPSSIVGGLDQP